MLFNSIEFLLFFPVVATVLFLLPKKYQWLWLLFASYFFYMSWNPTYALLIITSTIITFSTSIFIAKAAKNSSKKLWVFLSFFSNFFILGYFKYSNFLLELTSDIGLKFGFDFDLPILEILLPVGISFYTFQALSYTVDVYRGHIVPTKHFGKYALFVSFFPQLVAGPIERTTNLLPQFNRNLRFDYERFRNGILQVAWGFFKKVVIADRIAIVVDHIYDSPIADDGFGALIAMLFFAVQIYCDFSAYTDIAIGIARIMGFDLKKNFNNPYMAKSITDFWRRWHISLSTWFRDYVYIPLGGNKKGYSRTILNLFIVFLVSGLWHGASLTFVIWGAIHGFLIIIEKLYLKTQSTFYRTLNWDTNKFSFKLYRVLITFTLVTIAWVFFRAYSFNEAIDLIIRLKYLKGADLFNGRIYEYGLNKSEINVLIIGVPFLFITEYLNTRFSLKSWLLKQNMVFRWSVYIWIVFTLLIFGYYSNEQANFIYFQF